MNTKKKLSSINTKKNKLFFLVFIEPTFYVVFGVIMTLC